MEVPFPRAASKRLMSFFTFQISIFFSASLAWASLILTVDDASRSRFSRGLHDRYLTLQGTESRSIFLGGFVTWDCGLKSEAIF
jgi:hypothetical protein